MLAGFSTGHRPAGPAKHDTDLQNRQSRRHDPTLCQKLPRLRASGDHVAVAGRVCQKMQVMGAPRGRDCRLWEGQRLTATRSAADCHRALLERDRTRHRGRAERPRTDFARGLPATAPAVPRRPGRGTANAVRGPNRCRPERRPEARELAERRAGTRARSARPRRRPGCAERTPRPGAPGRRQRPVRSGVEAAQRPRRRTPCRPAASTPSQRRST